MEEERKEVAELRNKLLTAMTCVLMRDPLYNDDQIEALAEAFYWKVYELADFAGNEPKAFIILRALKTTTVFSLVDERAQGTNPGFQYNVSLSLD